MKKKLIRKAVAASSAAIMLATACISNIPVSAASSSTAVPGSALAFDVSTEVIKEKKTDSASGKITYEDYIKLTVAVTNNPGFETSTFAVVTDDQLSFEKQKFVYAGKTAGHDFVVDTDATPSAGKTTYMVSHTGTGTVTGTYNFELYFQADDYLTNSHTFQVCVSYYRSDKEGLRYSTYATDVPKDLYVTNNKTNITYILGDIDNDKKITINDAQGVMDIVSGNGGNAISVNTLNQLLQKDSLYSTNMTWRAKFPNLLCAEAADVTGTNKMIDDNDTKQVLSYYSQITAGGKPLSQIGTKRIKTITT